MTAVVASVGFLASLASVLGFTVADVWRHFASEPKTPVRFEPDPPTTPPETIGRKTATNAPVYRGLVSSSPDPRTERFVRFLERQDRRVVRLDVSVDLAPDKIFSSLRWGGVYAITFSGVRAARDNGTSSSDVYMSLTRPNTEDSFMDYQSGRAYIQGFFGVDTSLMLRPAHMGVKVLRLKPVLLG